MSSGVPPTSAGELQHFEQLLRQHGSPSSVEPATWVLLVLVAALAVVIAWWIRSRFLPRGDGHLAVFRRLATAGGLSRRQRSLVRHAARAAGLHIPAAVLLSRGCFDHLVATGARSSQDHEALASIGALMFDRPTDSAAGDDDSADRVPRRR